MAKPTIYDLLAKQGIDEITIAQLNTATSNSAVDEASIEFWKGPIVLQRVLQMRTYPWGLPIPERGAIFFEEVDALGVVTIQPPGTEIWEIKTIRGYGNGGSCTTAMAWADGTSALIFRPSDTIAQAGTGYDLNDLVSAPMQLTNSLYLTITETGGANGLMIQAAYTTVGL